MRIQVYVVIYGGAEKTKKKNNHRIQTKQPVAILLLNYSRGKIHIHSAQRQNQLLNLTSDDIQMERNLKRHVFVASINSD